MIKSPLRYPGGKSRAVKFLIKYLPEFKEFREPMIGGGSMSFYIAQSFTGVPISVSDSNYDLYCFWEQLKTNGAKLVSDVLEIYNAKSDGRKLYKSFIENGNEDLSELERAIRFFVLNRITFSGVVDSGGYSEASFNNRFTESSVNRLNSSSSLLSKFNIYNKDYSFLINKKGKDVFIFLDPPYYSVSKSKLYGKKGKLHTEFDHELFAETVKQCNHKWLITYDNSEYIRELFKDFHQVEWQLQYGMNNYRQSSAALGNEILIANYDLNKYQ